jgi:hypothetical protein
MPTAFGRRLLLPLTVILAICLAPTAASPAGQVVVLGSQATSHIYLTMKRGNLVVTGRVAHTQPRGCHITVKGVTCNLAGAEAIELDMGPSNDRVEVLDPLPLPLTVHLSAGRDKFIGNSEPDTCYSEGTKRNRCIGHGGNDVCITGQKNSDCVGNGGNDYCRHGAGSDGCWGGPGNDVCYMGPGKDGCHGEGGNDRIYGGSDPDQLYGGPGSDYCNGQAGIGRSHHCEAGPGH